MLKIRKLTLNGVTVKVAHRFKDDVDMYSVKTNGVTHSIFINRVKDFYDLYPTQRRTIIKATARGKDIVFILPIGVSKSKVKESDLPYYWFLTQAYLMYQYKDEFLEFDSLCLTVDDENLYLKRHYSHDSKYGQPIPVKLEDLVNDNR